VKKVRSKGTLKVSDVGNANIPKEIREGLQVEKGDIAYILDAHSAVLFNPNVDPETLAKSLKVLLEDLKLRIEDIGETNK